MTCAHCQGLESMFDQRTARRALRRYRRRGPVKTTRTLVEALRGEGIAGASLLDIGGGVGAVAHALLDAGAATGVSVDASAAYVEVSREEAQRRGLTTRIALRHGDFVTLAPEIPAADIVTLDRVVCCYPDAAALIGQSAARARRAYGLVLPRDTWWTRLGMKVVNLFLRLARNPMRTFVHPTAQVEGLLGAAGLVRRFRRAYVFWRVEVWGRPGQA